MLVTIRNMAVISKVPRQYGALIQAPLSFPSLSPDSYANPGLRFMKMGDT